ncbi:HSP20-like chaperone [Clathrospora elynae]|uniref:HSP20-like chaperone n=1 Tax=Clathrospora elynae TaxID=706981 RepID=A0A6A5ST64_9PLEO|nr:HSP20-like chaperone [Clathrospora elynae]
MPSVTYMNQSAPFWDFIASLEQQGPQQPSFAQNRNDEPENEHEQGEGHEDPAHPFGPWGWGQQFFGGGRGMPYRGSPPHGRPHHQHEGAAGEQNKEKNTENDAGQDDDNNGEGPSGNPDPDNEGHPYGRGHHGRCCGGRRGRCGAGARGGFSPRHGPGPHHEQHHGGRRGGWGPWGRGGHLGGMGRGPFGFGGNSFDPSTLVVQLWNQFNDSHPSNTNDSPTKPTEPTDHTPDTDIFDTESAYVVHVSLPGAKKEDVGVNWDAEKGELSIAGVVYRPGDEEFLKTLAMNERKVGPFERKIRLGTRASPAHIDADGITAKLEEGVLRVEVPKLDAGYVEIRKVDIE